jgi:hypothetical protein
MSHPEDELTCFLCDAPAECHKKDAENYRLFLCTNPKCGEYELSIEAMRRIKNGVVFDKAQASAEANKVKSSEKILRIFFDSATGQVTARIEARRHE